MIGTNAWKTLARGCAAASLAWCVAPARAEMVLDHVIVDFDAAKPLREDIEIQNTGPDTLYIVAEPAEVLEPGTPRQRRVASPDPRVSGLLVSPQRMVLDPGQRKLVRIAAIGPNSERDRIYRVTVKPVAGAITASSSAVKVFVGYDVLVIRRPAVIVGTVVAERSGSTIRLRNDGNTAVELFDGKQCDPTGKSCVALPATRLYSGASIDVADMFATPLRYRTLDGRQTRAVQF